MNAGVPMSSMHKKTVAKGRSGNWQAMVFGLLAGAALVIGWLLRDEYLVTAERGVGYFLGLAGGLSMLLLLLYPLRKKLPRTRWLVLSTPSWFKLHMTLGILAPLLILYHCNFSLGSTNSNVALFCMLLMVSSGIVGRYIYANIHFGLYGKRAEMRDLQTHKHDIASSIETFRHSLQPTHAAQLQSKLDAIELSLKQKGQSKSLFSAWRLTRTAKRSKHVLRGLLRHTAPNAFQNKEVEDFIQQYIDITVKMANLSFYERLFSRWHMLHLPIFFMLILSGFVHVYAVHFY